MRNGKKYVESERKEAAQELSPYHFELGDIKPKPTCPDCDGPMVKCKWCNGRGETIVPKNYTFPGYRDYEPCLICNGTGLVCPVCKGEDDGKK